MEFLKKAATFFKKEKAYTLLFSLCVGLSVFCWVFFPKGEVPEAVSPAMEKFRQVEALRQEKGLEKILELINHKPALAAGVFLFNLFLGAFFFLGIGTHGVVLLRRLRGQRVIEPLEETETAAWPAGDIVKFGILLFAFALLNGLFSNFFLLLCRSEFENGSGFLLWQASLMDFFVCIALAYLSSWKWREACLKLGLSLRHFLENVWLGILAYSWVIPVFVLVVVGLDFLIRVFHYEPPPHELIDILVAEDKKSPWIVAYSVVLACAIGPFIEEVFFRGFLYSALRRKWGVRAGIVVSSAFFALVHESWFAFFPIFFLGTCFAYVREKRRSLVPSIVMHVVHNSVLLAYFFFLKRGILDQI